MSTNIAKTLVWKQDYDVILWCHKQRTPNTNDYPMPLNETPPWKVSAYATGDNHDLGATDIFPSVSTSKAMMHLYLHMWYSTLAYDIVFVTLLPTSR